MVKFITTTLLPIATIGIFNTVSEFQTTFPQPIQITAEKITSEPLDLLRVRQALKIMGRDIKFAEDVYTSAKIKNIEPVFWACNIESESEYNRTAKSKAGYKGFGQTPKAVMKTGYDIADMTYAACVFDEKLKIAKGNQFKALVYYKGHGGKESVAAAKKVYNLYNKVNEQIKKEMEITNG